jgi:hypothetical protein
MTKILEHFEAMNFNKLLIKLKDLSSNAEQEAIFAEHPQLRPNYDFKQDPKITLKESVGKCLEIKNETMAVLLVLGQKENEDLPQTTASLIKNLTNRIQVSTQKVFDLYIYSK